MTPIQKATPLHWTVMLLAATMFASSFFVTHEVVKTVPPVTLAATRAVIGGVALAALLPIMGQRLPRLGRAWRPLLFLGVTAGLIPYVTIAWGQVHIPSGIGGILFGTIPLFTVFCAPFILRDERFTLRGLIGVLVGLGGVVLVIGPGALYGLGDQVLGQVVTLISALSYALSGMISRRLTAYHPAVLAAGQALCAGLYLIPLSLLIDRPWTLEVGAVHLGGIAWIAIAATGFPTILLFWLIRAVGATVGSLMAFFMPVAALILGIVVLGEEPGWTAYAGLGLILLGAGAVDGRLPFRRRRAVPAES